MITLVHCIKTMSGNNDSGEKQSSNVLLKSATVAPVNKSHSSLGLNNDQPTGTLSRRLSLRRQVLKSNLARYQSSFSQNSRSSSSLTNDNYAQYQMSRENLVAIDNDENSTDSSSSDTSSPKVNSPMKFFRSFVNHRKVKNTNGSLLKWDRLDPQLKASPSLLCNKENGLEYSPQTPSKKLKRHSCPKKIYKRRSFKLPRLSKGLSNNLDSCVSDLDHLRFSSLELSDKSDEGPPSKMSKIEGNRLQPPPAPLLHRKHYNAKINLSTNSF